MMMHLHTMFGYKELSGSENIAKKRQTFIEII